MDRWVLNRFKKTLTIQVATISVQFLQLFCMFEILCNKILEEKFYINPRIYKDFSKLKCKNKQSNKNMGERHEKINKEDI